MTTAEVPQDVAENVLRELPRDTRLRSWDMNPFAKRNRYYADHVEAAKSPYRLDESTISMSEDLVLTGEIIKTVGQKVITLPLTIAVLEHSIRVSIDEKQRLDGTAKSTNPNVQMKRFSIEPVAFAGPPAKADSAKFFKQRSGVYWIVYGDRDRVEIGADPFKVLFFRDGQMQVLLNERGYLNYEHWRAKDSKENNLGPYELGEGLWEDEFDGFKDEKSRGPESVALDVVFSGYRHVYGIPEHTDNMSLRETRGRNEDDHNEPYRLYNVDFEHRVDSPTSMYGAIPFMQGHKKGCSAGVFWANASDTYIDITKDENSTTSHWISETGLLDVFVFMGDSPADITRAYCGITGFPSLPQTFAIAYHQCRWNYDSEDDVLDVDAKFDKHDIPYDVIWLDIEYTDQKKYFTWDEKMFPHHIDMMNKLDENKRKLVAIIDPHIKASESYEVYRVVKENNLAVKEADGKNIFHGNSWPGKSVWIDSLNPSAQPFYDQWYSKSRYFGGDANNLHIWNDMNEPSVFSGPEFSVPKGSIHHGGWENRDVHNLVGFTFHNITVNSLKQRYSHTQRPFVLSRSYFAGSQRLSAIWTGDNGGSWEFLRAATTMILTQGICGFPFVGADVGGFFGNPPPELLTRWYQAGVFYPFFRAHASDTTKRREPYLAPEPYRGIIRDTIKLRYKLLPTIYTAFYRASTDALPIMRPLFYETPDNEEVYAIDDEFFVGGSGLLVKPVTKEGTTVVDFYLPDDEVYYDYSDYKEILSGKGVHAVCVTLEKIPILARGGHVHVRKDRERKSSSYMKHDPFTLVVAVSKYGKARGELYVDDGETYNYLKGEYVHQKFEYDNGIMRATNVHSSGTESVIGCLQIEDIIVIGDRTPRAATISQGSREWKSEIESLDGAYRVRNAAVVISDQWSIDLDW